jgi:hypothetical protein
LKTIALRQADRATKQKLQELKKSSGKQFTQLKTDLEKLIADFEKSVTQIEAKAKASWKRRGGAPGDTSSRFDKYRFHSGVEEEVT